MKAEPLSEQELAMWKHRIADHADSCFAGRNTIEAFLATIEKLKAQADTAASWMEQCANLETELADARKQSVAHSNTTPTRAEVEDYIYVDKSDNETCRYDIYKTPKQVGLIFAMAYTEDEAKQICAALNRKPALPAPTGAMEAAKSLVDYVVSMIDWKKHDIDFDKTNAHIASLITAREAAVRDDAADIAIKFGDFEIAAAIRAGGKDE